MVLFIFSLWAKSLLLSQIKIQDLEKKALQTEAQAEKETDPKKISELLSRSSQLRKYISIRKQLDAPTCGGTKSHKSGLQESSSRVALSCRFHKPLAHFSKTLATMRRSIQNIQKTSTI